MKTFLKILLFIALQIGLSALVGYQCYKMGATEVATHFLNACSKGTVWEFSDGTVFWCGRVGEL